MTTWEDILGQFVGLADKFYCATCLNKIFRGSTGHWGQRIVLNKVPVPGNLIDEESGRPITFQCPDCTGREPQVVPQVHQNGELVNHIRIADLNDADGEQTASFGDYDNREQHKAISEQPDIVNESEEELNKHDDSSHKEDSQETHKEDKEPTQQEEKSNLATED